MNDQLNGRLFAGIILGLIGRAADAQTCAPFWLWPQPSTTLLPELPLVVFDDGSGPALIGEAFLPAAPLYTQHRVVRWKGWGWEILDQGLPPLAGIGQLLALDDGAGPRLYAAGSYYSPNVEYFFVVWNGSAWQPAPAGLLSNNNPVRVPVCSFDDGSGSRIYGFGDNNTLNKWDGSQWTTIGYAYGSFIMRALQTREGPGLFICGQFNGIEGVPDTQGIARWDGRSWSALGNGIDASPTPDMCVFDSGQGKDLYVCAVNSNGGVIKWDGQQWSNVSLAPGNSVDHMAVFDDGEGPALFAAGSIGSVEGQPCHGFAKFDGQHWHPVHGTVASSTYGAVVPFLDDPRGPSLFVYGASPAHGLGQFVGCAGGRTCYANCDVSSVPPLLNVNDFMCFINRFASVAGPFRDVYADCDQDGQFTIADFQCFINKFTAGCP